MRIYKDIFTGDEMFSDIYKMKLLDNVVYEIYGKYEIRRNGEVQLEGANPSAEEVSEGTQESVVSGVDIVLNHNLVETHIFDTKKAYTAYLKEYMKRLVKDMDKKNTPTAEVELFKTNMNKVMKDILPRFKDFQFFTGASMESDGTIAICEYRDIDGVSTPVFMMIKQGLEEEKF